MELYGFDKDHNFSYVNVHEWYISNNLTVTMYFAVLLFDRDDDWQMYKTCVIEKSNYYDV